MKKKKPKIITNGPCMLCVDPGLAECGLALLGLSPVRIIDICVSETKTQSGKKGKVFAHEDIVRRILEFSSNLTSFLKPYETSNIILIAAEAVSYPRNAAACAMIGACWGVVARMADRELNVRIIQVSPKEAKRRICKNAAASKEEVCAAVKELFPDWDRWPDAKKVLHITDAVAVGVACMEDPEVRAIVKYIEGK